MSPEVIVSGGFDNPRARDMRFLEEAAHLGTVTVLLWPDAMLEQTTGKPPRFPLQERLYVLESLRYVARAVPILEPFPRDTLPPIEPLAQRLWVDQEKTSNAARREYCRDHGLEYHVLVEARLAGFPAPAPLRTASGRKKVLATGCYDWFHSGHVRFFEELSAYGDLYVVVGHDANIRLLKGEGHPLLSQDERRYAVASVKFVKEALISSGSGWLDADPEIRALRPDIYAVNEDGDRGGKREYCQQLGIEYLVLKRKPRPGLDARNSTLLRGF